MIKRTAALIMCAVLVCFAACSAPAGKDGETQVPESKTPLETMTPTCVEPTPGPEETQTGTDAPSDTPLVTMNNYAAAYEFYSGLTDALTKAVDDCLMAMNEKLESEDPEGYYDDPTYYTDFFAPFLSVSMAFTASFTDDIDPETAVAGYELFGFEQPEFSLVAPDKYRVTYTDEQETGEVNEYEDICSYSEGAIRFESFLNGKSDEFFEYIPLGEDRYAIQSRTSRAVVAYRGGEIAELLLSETRHEMDLDSSSPASWSVFYDPDADSIIGAPALDREWVLEKQAEEGLYHIYELDPEGVFTYSGYSKTGSGERAVFVPFEPVVLRFS